MPLHDWGRADAEVEWPGVHQMWAGEIIIYLKPRLPEGYRATLAAAPKLARLGVAEPRRARRPARGRIGRPRAAGFIAGGSGTSAALEPDVEVAVPSLELEPVGLRQPLAGGWSPRSNWSRRATRTGPSRREATASAVRGLPARRGQPRSGGRTPPAGPCRRRRGSVQRRVRVGASAAAGPVRGGLPGREDFDGPRPATSRLWQFPLAAGEPSCPRCPVPLSPTKSVTLDLD